MHKLNFCGTLCLPKAIEGFPARGMDIITSFKEAHLVPMAGAATPLHVLYASKPIKICDGRSEFLEPSDIDEEDKMYLKYEIEINDLWIAADHAVDPDTRADFVFRTRNNSLAFIVEQLFREDHKKVVIWANNGIGKTVDKNSNEDGVLRDYGLFREFKEGIAYAVRLDGKVYEQYQKGLKDTYQNSAHQHIHIAPTKPRAGFGPPLLAKLDEYHDGVTIASLMEYREMIADDPERYLPCIAVCVLDKESDLGKNLQFTFYANSDLTNAALKKIEEGEKMAGLARKTILDHSKSKGLDFNDKKVKKKYIAETKEFYEKILN